VTPFDSLASGLGRPSGQGSSSAPSGASVQPSQPTIHAPRAPGSAPPATTEDSATQCELRVTAPGYNRGLVHAARAPGSAPPVTTEDSATQCELRGHRPRLQQRTRPRTANLGSSPPTTKKPRPPRASRPAPLAPRAASWTKWSTNPLKANLPPALEENHFEQEEAEGAENQNSTSVSASCSSSAPSASSVPSC